MPPNPTNYNPLFDEENWQWGIDDIQQKLLVRLNQLSQRYAQLQQQHQQAPTHLKPGIYKRLQWLEGLITDIEECTTLTRDYMGSAVIRLRMEYEQAIQANNLDMALLQESLQVTNNVALTLCEKLISINNKNNIK